MEKLLEKVVGGGLASAGFKIILVIKCLLMAFSTNGVKAASKTEGGNFL